MPQSFMPHTTDWLWPFECIGCGFPYPAEGIAYRCPACGDPFDFRGPLIYSPREPLEPGHRGLERYRDTLPLPPRAPLISLGEGSTPLLAFELEGRNVFFKCEHVNPTGSFKDRGSVALVSALAAMGVEEAVEDSSGNAGASFAAYAARAGIRAKVFIPQHASGPKRAQIEAYGAEVVCVEGPRSAAADAVRREVEEGAVYASHVYLPHGLAGMATIAFEIVEQLGQAPGTVVMPVGHGTLLIGVFRGFEAMINAGQIECMPCLVGVQAKACAPIWVASTLGSAELKELQEGETVAEGVRILNPIRMEAVLAAIEGSEGRMVAVDEGAIQAGRAALGRCGLYVEPTSAVVWPAMMTGLAEFKDPVVAILTGSGFKAFKP